MRAQGDGIAPGPRAACAEKARRGRFPCGLFCVLRQVIARRPFSVDAAYGFAISSAYPCSRGACLQRLARRMEARKVIVDGLGGHPFVLQRRGAGGLGCASVAHGDSPCGISLQFDDALTVALALFRVRLARWVLARLCSFVLTP